MVFLLRALYDLLLATGLLAPMPIDQGHMQYAVPFYLLTDIFPTLLLLLYFRAIPRTPPRPRHIPSATSTPQRGRGGGGSATAGSAEGLGASLLPDGGRYSSGNSGGNGGGSVSVNPGDGGSSARAQPGPGAPTLFAAPPAAASSAGSSLFGSPAVAGAGAFDPFKSDGVPEFGAGRRSSSSGSFAAGA